MNKKYSNISIVLACILVGNTNAQQLLTGKLTQKETQNPIEKASVELLSLPDSAAIEKMITNAKGVFTSNKVDTTKTYCLRIKHLGYEKVLLTVPPLKKNKTCDVGIIKLEPTILSLSEVVINGSKVLVTELSDRTVYGMSGDMKKTSTDGLDLLRKVPSVMVDYFNEEITVDGKSNIKIEVDGVPRNKDFIKKLHPSQIDKMEIVTSPSGKYDATIDAVINVVTIPEMRYGLKGTLNAQVLPNNKNAYMGRFNGSLDYGLKKISYYVASNFGVQNFNFLSNLERYTNNNLLQRNNSLLTKSFNGSINMGLIFDPNKMYNLNFNIWYSGRQSKNDGDNFSYNSENSVLERIYETTSQSNNNTGGLNTSFFYKHKFDKKTQHSFEIDANGYNSMNNNNKTKYQIINYSTENTELSHTPFLTEENKTNLRTIDTHVNYTLPFDSVYTFRIGIGGNYNKNSVNNISSLSKAPNLDYRDMRGSFFTELSKSFKKGSVKVGTRIEVAHITINSASNNNYISPIPYANSQFKINKKNSLKFAFSRRIIRPLYSQLNPFVSVIDSQTLSHGNINLKPANMNIFQVTYYVKYGKNKFNGSLSPQLFYEYKTRLIQNIMIAMPNTNTFEIVPQNIANGYLTGIGITMSSQISKVTFNSNIRYYYGHIDSYKDMIKATNKKGWNWNFYAVSPLPFNLRLYASLKMPGPIINGQQESKMSPTYVVGVVKQFNNNSNLNIMVLNIFAPKFSSSVTTLSNRSFSQKTESYMNLKNAIMLNYSYNFKIGKAINLKKRDMEENTEENNEENNNLPF